MTQTKEFTYLNDLKEGEINIMPKNVVQAFKMSKLSEYLSFRFRGIFGLSKEMKKDQLDF